MSNIHKLGDIIHETLKEERLSGPKNIIKNKSIDFVPPGAHIVYGDTDSVLYVIPKIIQNKDQDFEYETSYYPCIGKKRYLYNKFTNK